MESALRIRHPAWAGQFYPRDPEVLRAQIVEYLNRAPAVEIQGEILGLVSPHAGYEYSGQTAAAGYKLLEGRDIRTVIVLAPSHAAPIRGVSLFNGDYYETPLGRLPVATELARELAAEAENVHLSGAGHESGGMQPEHSLEVQLPFLQAVLGNDFELLPMVFHDYSWANCRELGEGIARVIEPKKTLIVASSDLYHGYSYEECQRTDARTIEAILAFNPEKFCEGANAQIYQACGAGPIAAMQVATKKWGADHVQLIAQTNSADVTGLTGGWTVGYASLAIVKS